MQTDTGGEMNRDWDDMTLLEKAASLPFIIPLSFMALVIVMFGCIVMLCAAPSIAWEFIKRKFRAKQ